LPEKMVIPKINLHIHSTYSDGKNTIDQIVKKAIDYELRYIAITDHFTNSWKAKVIPNLNSIVKIDNYLEDLSEQQYYLKQKNTDLRLLKGIEIDISSSENYILSLINPYKFDILLFEYLENPEGIAFIKNVILNWKKLYKSERKFPILGLAHFDPSFFIYGSLNILISFLKEFNIYFEFNSSYPQYYSVKFQDFFIELGKNNIMVAIGCDSHNLVSLNDIEELVNIIRKYGLIDNLLALINKL